MMGYRRSAPRLYYQLSLDRLVPQSLNPSRLGPALNDSNLHQSRGGSHFRHLLSAFAALCATSIDVTSFPGQTFVMLV